MNLRSNQSRTGHRARGNLFALGFLVPLLFISTGCVERRMTIRSTPSGALVILDGQEIGHTPVSVSFTYYGDREVKLIKDGYETKTIIQTVSPPWYQFLGLDFVSEVLIPRRIRDERTYGGPNDSNVYTLQPLLMVPNDQLMSRAEAVRNEARNPAAELPR